MFVPFEAARKGYVLQMRKEPLSLKERGVVLLTAVLVAVILQVALFLAQNSGY